MKGSLGSDAGLEIHSGLVAPGTLGGDDDDTAGSCGTVKCGGGSVLEDGEGLDIVGVETASCDAVNDVQRACACIDGAGTADADVGACTRLAGGVHNHNAGNLALEHIAHVGGRDVGEFLTGDGDDGAGEFCLLLGGISQDDDFLERLGVGREFHVDDGLTAHFDLRALVAQAGEGEYGVIRSVDDIFAFIVGHRAAARGKGDSCTDDRLSVRGVHYRTRDTVCLGIRGNAHKQHSCRGKDAGD